VNYKNIIESILLVSPKPVFPEEIAKILDIKTDEVAAYINELKKDYEPRGIKITHHMGLYELTSDPQNATFIAKFLNQEIRGTLSQAALETLAIIFYKQPITRGGVEEVRGVNSDQSVRNLLIRGLIEERGRKETPGKPILYGTSINFIKHLGLSSEEELPTFETIIGARAN
jgi:segregation and condensation protein B